MLMLFFFTLTFLISPLLAVYFLNTITTKNERRRRGKKKTVEATRTICTYFLFYFSRCFFVECQKELLPFGPSKWLYRRQHAA